MPTFLCLMMITPEDRIRGLLFGLAAGDQIGGPIRMAMQLSKSLLDRDGFDEKSVLRHYYTWWNEAGFDTGYVAHSVFAKMKQGKLNREAVEEIHQLTGEKTGGCNPMHRAIPLALINPPNIITLIDSAIKEAKLTHYDPIAGNCSSLVLVLCHLLLNNNTLSESLHQVATTPHLIPLRLNSEINDILNFDPNKPKLGKTLSNGGYSPDVLRAALYFLQTHDTYETALSASIAFAGAENFCPVIVGAIAGVQYGYNSIPDHFMKHPTLMTQLESISDKFIKQWQS